MANVRIDRRNKPIAQYLCHSDSANDRIEQFARRRIDRPRIRVDKPNAVFAIGETETDLGDHVGRVMIDVVRDAVRCLVFVVAAKHFDPVARLQTGEHDRCQRCCVLCQRKHHVADEAAVLQQPIGLDHTTKDVVVERESLLQPPIILFG